MDTSEILFLGNLVPKYLQKEVYEKNKKTAQDSGTAFQNKIINGLDANSTWPVKICNIIPVSSFPNYYKDWIVKGSKWSHDSHAEDINIGFINLAYVKRVFLSLSYCKSIKKIFKTKNNIKSVVCYSTNSALLDGLKVTKQINPKVKTCLIIPDMPEFNDLTENKSLIYQWYIKKSAKKLRDYFQYIDCFVYMTEQSAKYLNAHKPYIVMEGIADERRSTVKKNNNGSNIKTVLYTGTTNQQFGIPTLLKAFELIKGNDYRLVICGCGDYDKELKKAEAKDNRIKIMGVVPHDKVVVLQQKATVLVNPRQNIGMYTKFSFPSKIMEYLSSGTPVIAYKLDGIPMEYDSYINYVPDNSIESLEETILSVINRPSGENIRIGNEAKLFVSNNKNYKIQGKRIVDMISNLKVKNE